ncbi:MAG: hypothetical protein Fur0024_2600 [Patescibacteria group bacterium]
MFKFLKINFPKFRKPILWEEPNVRAFYLIDIFQNGWFIKATWVLFFLKILSYDEIGIFDSLAFVLGFFLEIPSGAIADFFGRKKTMLFGFFVGFLSAFMMAFGNREILILGSFLIQFSYAFLSGTTESFIFDSLKEKKLEKNFDEVLSNSGGITKTTSLLVGVIGGFLYKIWNPLPFLFFGIFYFLGFLISLKVSEPKYEKKVFHLKITFPNLLLVLKIFQRNLHGF